MVPGGTSSHSESILTMTISAIAGSPSFEQAMEEVLVLVSRLFQSLWVYDGWYYHWLNQQVIHMGLGQRYIYKQWLIYWLFSLINMECGKMMPPDVPSGRSDHGVQASPHGVGHASTQRQTSSKNMMENGSRTMKPASFTVKGWKRDQLWIRLGLTHMESFVDVFARTCVLHPVLAHMEKPLGIVQLACGYSP